MKIKTRKKKKKNLMKRVMRHFIDIWDTQAALGFPESIGFEDTGEIFERGPNDPRDTARIERLKTGEERFPLDALEALNMPPGLLEMSQTMDSRDFAKIVRHTILKAPE